MWCVLTLLLVASSSLDAQPISAQLSERHLTIYQNGMAFARERWTARLTAGQTLVAFPGISLADPTSVEIQGPERMRIAWHSVAQPPSSGEEALKRLQGRSLRFISPEKEQVITGTLVKVLPNHALVRTPAGLLLLPSPNEFRILVEEEVPELTTPISLTALVETDRSGEVPLTVAYLTDALRWQAVYTLYVPPRGTSLRLCGFAHVENSSERNYDSAYVSLVAGYVPQMSAIPEPFQRAQLGEALLAKSPREPSPTEMRGVYRYTLPRILSLPANSSIQVPLLPCTDSRSQWLYIVEAFADGSGSLPVLRLLRIANTSQNGLGQPLPKGIARVFVLSGDTLELLGIVPFPETPTGDTATIELGPTFELKARQQTVERRELGSDLVEESYALTLLNGGQEPATVEIRFRLRWDQQNWRVTSTTHPHRRIDATTVGFRLTVPAGAESSLRFTLLSQRPPR
ncbi:MAG: hypothetical protein ABDH31_02390 [Chlorobiota bacterium]